MVYVRKEGQSARLKQSFIDRNQDRWTEYELLGDYVNKETKILFRHNCGHEFLMTPHNFSQGHGCPVCAKEMRRQSLRQVKDNKFLDFIEAHKDEYELLSEYVNVKTPVEMRHLKCGTTFSRIPSTFYHRFFNGCLCPKCNASSLGDKYRYTVEQANKRLGGTNQEYEFLTYNGAANVATIKHKVCGHVFQNKASYFLLGDGHCPKCTTNISKDERAIYDWLKSVCSDDVVQNDRTVLSGRELDIYIPSKHVAIEYNGHYWHSLGKLSERMTMAEAKNYHRAKSLECEARGVRLIHVWDYEWADQRKQAVLKNIILGAMQALPRRLYARECKVHYYDTESPRWGELSQFFAENNIQGNRGGQFVYTLEKDGEILMAYKFGRPSGGRAKIKYQYEMVRGASAPGVQVIGGATRLWKHFIREKNPDSVVYYIDYNYFNGNSVEKIGLKLVGGQAGVRNYWVDTNIVKNREPARHHEVKQAIAGGKCLELWNAGVKTYEYRRQD